VSSIGRELASGIFRKLRAKKSSFFASSGIQDDLDVSDIVEVVAAACLAHDIGNPPFGHIGEFAIQSWFSDQTLRQARPGLAKVMTSEKRKDFERFDGNAQAFRILTRLQGWGYDRGGLRLTAATLGALVKYPNASHVDSGFKEGKFGFYDSEKDVFENLAARTNMLRLSEGKFARHPLAFITEAADDIAYLTSDVEDAVKFGMISYEEAEEVLRPIARKMQKFNEKTFNNIDETKNKLKFLRSFTSLSLTQYCVETFLKFEEDIIKGFLPIRLLPTPTKCRVGPFSRVEPVEGRRCGRAGDSEQ